MERAALPIGTVGTALKALMLSRGLRVADVARATGLTRLTVRQWRDSKVTRVKFETLSRMCAGLRVEPGALLVYLPPEPQKRRRRSSS